ncbi:MAG: flavodoxin [Oscillospiraceae bacterium]|nr:flavodoxin [Oscillospiraceae bacterium]
MALLLAAATLLTTAGCGRQASQEPTATPENPPATDSQQTANQPETASSPVNVSTTTPEQETPRILIAYFTWADNTIVENPSAVDVDATTSASVLAPGNAAKIAGWIQQEVGGDLFSIVVSEPYSSDYDECLDRAADEKAAKARPALVNHVDGMENYDIVFLGFPNWWYTLPMAVLSFVEEYDFSGKTVVPFCTHGTGGLAGTIRDLTAALPEDVTILDPIGVYRPEVDSSRPAVQEWVAGLNLDI